ncbi:pimeloyl-ACP methyl ester carboxylesterase [Paenibacillus intestini]|uniref:Alpha/beta hydrolase n=1 Tax=Paenibacillus cucumis (ex Kampfer et al. 2016) TaxID=1776858 RepID=A0ABS7KEP2_9BACL|nr:alpha/beta hydrolase [Paenibacillus cucumis (ex Kampfer et al. 2016)]MBY0202407.1 alpha/beta hydrolase [Paenibacillus cucumis (ex Kampfer et al. 2016)]MDP9701545.1 pimeloyl-ACP methyl ester carboxylesterase [Paenibacillus intestini]
MERYKSPQGRQLIYQSYDKLLQSYAVHIEEEFIETSFGQTHVITAGDPHNPSLLLFHGTADNAAMMWMYNMNELSKKFYVIAVDSIGGSGKSEPNAEYFKRFDQVKWMDDIMDAFQLHNSYICGVSYGAYLSYFYTLKRPDRIRKAMCLAGGISSSTFEVMVKMMKAFMPEALFLSEKNCEKLLRKLCGPNYAVFAENEELMRHWTYLLKYFNNKSMMKHRIQFVDDVELATLVGKAKFLIGEHDILSNYPKAIHWLQRNQLNYEIIRDAGHAINHEQADLVNQKIIEFWNE